MHQRGLEKLKWLSLDQILSFCQLFTMGMLLLTDELATFVTGRTTVVLAVALLMPAVIMVSAMLVAPSRAYKRGPGRVFALLFIGCLVVFWGRCNGRGGGMSINPLMPTFYHMTHRMTLSLCVWPCSRSQLIWFNINFLKHLATNFRKVEAQKAFEKGSVYIDVTDFPVIPTLPVFLVEGAGLLWAGISGMWLHVPPRRGSHSSIIAESPSDHYRAQTVFYS